MNAQAEALPPYVTAKLDKYVPAYAVPSLAEAFQRYGDARAEQAVAAAMTEAAERIDHERLDRCGHVPWEHGMKDAAAIVRDLIPTAAPPP